MKIIKTDDLLEIKELWEKLNLYHYEKSVHFKEIFKNKTFEKRFKGFNENKKVAIFYAEDNGVKLGYIIATKGENGAGEIDSLYINEGARGKSLGEKLMTKAIEFLKAVNAKNIHLVVAAGNEDAFGFYAKMGFYPRIHTLKYVNNDEL